MNEEIAKSKKKYLFDNFLLLDSAGLCGYDRGGERRKGFLQVKRSCFLRGEMYRMLSNKNREREQSLHCGLL